MQAYTAGKAKFFMNNNTGMSVFASGPGEIRERPLAMGSAALTWGAGCGKKETMIERQQRQHGGDASAGSGAQEPGA
ncbi:MAG: hypothetical protein MZV70_08325 [Desulfobacterales bacterium]|nr:hypothetical protein [Desulfobacterales bacterium]